MATLADEVSARPTQPILVVDDDPDNRSMLVVALASQGYAAIAASDGAEALVLARQQKPCLILLDLMMPVMDGPSFRRAQWGDPSICEIPVVVISAHHEASEIAVELKAVGCVQKPIMFDLLIEAVQTACDVH